MTIIVFTPKRKNEDRYLGHMGRALRFLGVPPDRPVSHFTSDEAVVRRAEISDRLRSLLGVGPGQILWCAEVIADQFGELPFARRNVLRSYHWLFSPETIDRTIRALLEKGVIDKVRGPRGSVVSVFRVRPFSKWGRGRASARTAGVTGPRSYAVG